MDGRWLIRRQNGGKAFMDAATEASQAGHGDGGLIRRQSPNIIDPDYSQLGVCECYRRFSYDRDKGAFLAFLVIALILVTFAALLAGLTLAISSLDMTWLHVMSTTGSEKRRLVSLCGNMSMAISAYWFRRRQADVVSKIKRRASWFLCSMILVSVICLEALPIIVQSLFGTGWIPVIISTIAITLFAELLPQYIIPRQALQWGYYCWPFIWVCMWLTAIISWPLSNMLDRLTLPREHGTLYTNEQLAVLIQLHERQEKHGGVLGPDAGRIARGALDLDGRTLEKPYLQTHHDRKDVADDIYDPEKADCGSSDVIVPWSTVKYITIDDEVNEQFITKIKQMSYSRIPVVGNEDSSNLASINLENGLKGQRLFGFLHVKNLLGLDLSSEDKKLFVKDLTLYPLPIVRDDMPLYDLLNMFQLGMSRMAIVIPGQARDWTNDHGEVYLAKEGPSRVPAPLWSSSGGLNARESLDIRAINERVDWTTDFLDAARNESEESHVYSIFKGIRCPTPLGIITFEDILDTLLQKTSRDEKDFFDRRTFDPPTKFRKEGDDTFIRSTRGVFRARNAIPIDVDKIYAAFDSNHKNQGALRKRNNVSGHGDGMDGTADVRLFGLDGNDDRSLNIHGALVNDRSSYTENSHGGFHGPSSSADTELSTMVQRNISVKPKLRRQKGRSITSTRTVSSPVNNTVLSDFIQLDSNPALRRASCDFLPLIGRMYGVPLHSRGIFSSLDEVPICSEDIAEAEILRSTIVNGGWNQYTAMPSYCNSEVDIVPGLKANSTTGHAANEIRVVGNKMHTLPRVKSQQPVMRKLSSQGVCQREESFHDDRSLLPSQRKGVIIDSQGSPTRRTSFWV